MNPPAEGWSLTLPPRLWAELSAHLFGDGDEHGAILLAAQASGPRGPRLLGRELIRAVDDHEYVGGATGYRALSATFVRDAAIRARDEKLAYLAIHNHRDLPGVGTVSFSRVDLASHERGYPALRKITGQVIGGVVLTPRAVAGDLWLPDGSRVDLAELVVPDNNLLRLRPRPAQVCAGDPQRDRQARLFGDRGQETLRQMRVAVVGLGGAGSIIVEFLARLGVGHLVLVDDDRVDLTNLPRLLAAEPGDAGMPKVDLASRNARRAHPDITLTPITRRVEHPAAQAALAACDWIFLAADGHAARHWVNMTVHQHLIPCIQVGVKIPVFEDGDVGEIHTVTRLLLPGEGCLWCNGLVNSTELAIDMLSAADRAAARYIQEVPAASVIALNGITASEAVNHFLLATTNLHHDDSDRASVLHQPRARTRYLQESRQSDDCPWCTVAGVLGRGDG